MFNIVKNIFSVVGLIGSIILISSIETISPNDWKWSERENIKNRNKSAIAIIEIGKHDDAGDRIRILLKNEENQSQELWSSYAKAEPSVTWVSDTSLVITYTKEESHSFWPEVELNKIIYNIALKYR